MQLKFNFPEDAVHVIEKDNGDIKVVDSLDDVDILDDCPLCQMLKEDLAKKR